MSQPAETSTSHEDESNVQNLCPLTAAKTSTCHEDEGNVKKLPPMTVEIFDRVISHPRVMARVLYFYDMLNKLPIERRRKVVEAKRESLRKRTLACGGFTDEYRRAGQRVYNEYLQLRQQRNAGRTLSDREQIFENLLMKKFNVK